MNELARQEQERRIWQTQAASYDTGVMKTFKNAYDLSIQKVLACLQPDSQVLEIGCGTGIIALGVAPHVNRVVATDICPEMVETAQAKAANLSLRNVEFHVADGYAQPFVSESFDAVLVFNVLHVVREPKLLLREANRLLKPAGYLATATDCYDDLHSVRAWLMGMGLRLLRLVGIIPVLHFYRKGDLRRLFEQAGFSVVETEVLHPAPVNYYVLGRKK